MSDLIDKQKQRLRQYLNPAIRGPNTDSVLESLATGAAHLIYNVSAVNDMLYVATAAERYLDERMADRNLSRPENVGLSDDVFRKLGISVTNRKQVKDLMNKILEIMYGDEFTRATLSSSEFENYALIDGDSLKIQYDDGEIIEVFFSTSQFTNISSATAQEVADSITKSISRLGKNGAAIAKNDGSGGYVMLISETVGSASSVKVVGGRAQNVLKFPNIRPTSGDVTTQWTLTLQSGGNIRATWTGGSNPSVGKVKKNDYVNIFGTSFDANNKGSFVVTAVQGGIMGDAYVEYINQIGVTETVVQGSSDAVLFYNPFRSTITSKLTYAAAYQSQSRLLEIFMPATTKVVRRDRIGSSHLYESGAAVDDNFGSYVWDESKNYIIGEQECNTTALIDSSTGLIIEVDNASNIPDESGHLIFGFGTSKEEGPVPYISRPSNTNIMVNPSYRFKYIHEAGTNISLVVQNYSYRVATNGTDYPFYITDVVSGRLYAEEIINYVAATGINVVITILYSNSIGLGHWNRDGDEKYYVWGGDND